MTLQEFGLIVAAFVAVGSLAANIAQGRISALQNRTKGLRDDKDVEIKGRAQDNADEAAVLLVAQKNIEMLEKQNELLEKQMDADATRGIQREVDWRKREEEWRREKRNFETRIGELEKFNRALAVQMNEMGVCTLFDSCGNFKPPVRRIPDTGKAEGTD